MTQVNVLEAKNNLSKLLALLESGEEQQVVIARNGTPIAQLTLIGADVSKRIGVARGQKLMADGYDLDDDNDLVAELFGVV